MSKQRIFIAGHRGMVGSAIRRQLEQRGDVELVLRTRDELNLLDSRAVHDFFASERIDQVYLAAADAPRDKCAHFREINGIAAAFQHLQKNYNPIASSFL